MAHALTVDSGRANLGADTDPASIEPVLAGTPDLRWLQLCEPLTETLYAAAANALRKYPEVGLRAWGRSVDPSLDWLAGFEHIEHLTLDLWGVSSFEVLERFKGLRSLSLGETESKRPSLAFLKELPQLDTLVLEAHDRDFAAVGEVATLTTLRLRVPRVKSLEALRGHTGIKVFTMDFGGIRDLSPIASLPNLEGLQLYQVRKFDTDDLAVLGDCRSLVALSLGALRNVANLRALTHAPSKSLRLLILERLTGLDTLADLASCDRLEQLGLYESRPADKRLDPLLKCQRLQHLVVGDVYPKEQVNLMKRQFRGGLQYRGLSNPDVLVRWRAPVDRCLEGLM